LQPDYVSNSPKFKPTGDMIAYLSVSYRNDSSGAKYKMRKRSPITAAIEVEERFLLQALHRLRTAEQRYVFTLMADLISQGMATQEARSAGAATK
jgi:hypothetical protein